MSDSSPVSRQPAELLHTGTDTSTYSYYAANYIYSLLWLSSQASSYQEVGKVTGDGLIKGHAYAITDTEKVSITQTGPCRVS